MPNKPQIIVYPNLDMYLKDGDNRTFLGQAEISHLGGPAANPRKKHRKRKKKNPGSSPGGPVGEKSDPSLKPKKVKPPTLPAKKRNAVKVREGHTGANPKRKRKGHKRGHKKS